jgi:TetR/AcrR family fatty acid metabolism transcriptional regulator
MSPRARPDPAARRDGLVTAARRRFASQGVAGTTVSDIVREAGVAQGTFYLYFASKDEIVIAVVEGVGDELFNALATAVDRPGTSAVDAIRGMGSALGALAADPAFVRLATFLHLPENQAIHDRLSEHLLPRLVPLLESVISRGIAEGDFEVPDTPAATWFVLGGLRSVELAGTPIAQMPAALDTACALALRVLGYEGPDER